MRTDRKVTWIKLPSRRAGSIVSLLLPGIAALVAAVAGLTSACSNGAVSYIPPGGGGGGGAPPIDAGLPFDSGDTGTGDDVSDAGTDLGHVIDANCPSFQQDIWPLITQVWHCGQAGPCHKFSEDGGVKPYLDDLSTAQKCYDTMNTSNPRLITQGNSSTAYSLLYCVISGPACGPPMPNGGGAAAADQLTVEEWVWCGQPDN